MGSMAPSPTLQMLLHSSYCKVLLARTNAGLICCGARQLASLHATMPLPAFQAFLSCLPRMHAAYSTPCLQTSDTTSGFRAERDIVTPPVTEI